MGEGGLKWGTSRNYRRIKRYYKTLWQYWKERNRRKQILCLLEDENLNQRQIAERLGC